MAEAGVAGEGAEGGVELGVGAKAEALGEAASLGCMHAVQHKGSAWLNGAVIVASRPASPTDMRLAPTRQFASVVKLCTGDSCLVAVEPI